jgi:hypothetical protein
MSTFLLETSVYVHRPFPVEFLIDVDGRVIRTAIGWPVVEQIMSATPIDDEQVRNFLHENREAIARAIQARLYAHGVPRTGELVMALDDFDQARLTYVTSVNARGLLGTGAGDVRRDTP